MRIGLVGGTFNPIHVGHLRIAEEVRELFELEEIHFIPSFIPPHKQEENMASPGQRLAMVRRAIESNPAFIASELELQRGGPSYTVDTLNAYHGIYESRLEPYFLLGMDAFLEITTWKRYEELFRLTHFVVVSRPGYRREELAHILPVELVHEFQYNEKEEGYRHHDGYCTYFRDIHRFEISSSEIRRCVREGRSIRYLVPEGVRKYIEQEGLYRETHTKG